MTRVTAGTIPELRAARRASVPLSNTFLCFRFIPSQFRSPFSSAKKLKAERRLQIDAAVRSPLGKRPGRESRRLAEETRTHGLPPSIQAYLFEDVPHRHRQH